MFVIISYLQHIFPTFQLFPSLSMTDLEADDVCNSATRAKK